MFVKRKDFEELKAVADNLNKTLQEMNKRPYLVNITRNGLSNVLTFMQEGETFTIECVEIIRGDKDKLKIKEE